MDFRLSSEYEFNVVNHLYRIPVDLILIKTTIDSYINFEKGNSYWKDGDAHALEGFGLSIPALLVKTKRLANALGHGAWNRDTIALLLRGQNWATGADGQLEREILQIKKELEASFSALRSEYYVHMKLADRDSYEWGHLSLPNPADSLSRLGSDLSSCFLPLEKKRYSAEEVHRMFRSHWLAWIFQC